MNYRALNLSGRPFRNVRPVWRVSIFMWLIGALLLALNTYLFWDFLSGKDATGTRLREIDESVRKETQRIETLKQELERFDLRAQNEEVEFLNEKIAQRLFSWSGLFEDLAAALPDDVRLERLTPNAGDSDSRSGRGRDSGSFFDGRVLLKIQGYARSDQSLLVFVDSLFSHPAFESPKLLQETTDDTGLRRFNIEVTYRPSVESASFERASAAVVPAPVPAPLGRPASSPPIIRSGNSAGGR